MIIGMGQKCDKKVTRKDIPIDLAAAALSHVCFCKLETGSHYIMSSVLVITPERAASGEREREREREREDHVLLLFYFEFLSVNT